MYYPENVVEQIREQSDIVSVISDYTHLTKKGNSHFGLCPFHNEKTPSFSVSDDKQMYYCFGCGAGGNVFTFLMQKENMNFVEALQHLADKLHIELTPAEMSPEQERSKARKEKLLEIHKLAARFFYFALGSGEHTEAVTYLQERGLDQQVVKHFGMGYAPAEYNVLYKYLRGQGYEDDLLLESGLILKSKEKGVLYDRFSDRIMFPIFNLNKKVIAFGGRIIKNGEPKYLNSPESPLFDKSRTLYGLHLARASAHPYYILVEGYMDVIAMHRAGFTQTVASLGTAFTVGHAKLLKRYTNQVVILYDSDDAGVKASMRAIPILRAEGIHTKVLHLKAGKDPDEFLKQHGADELQGLLENAQSDTWFKIRRLETEFNIKIPEQKILFLQETARIIGELESSIEQNVYMREIATTYQVDFLALEAEVKKYYNSKLSVKTNQPTHQYTTVTKKTTSSFQSNFLSVVYHYPYVFPYIESYIDYTMFDEGLLQDLAKNIFDSIRQGTELSIGHFNTAYPEVADQRIVSEVLMYKDSRYEDEELLKKMLTETIKRLNATYLEQKLKTSTDIQEVSNLLSKKKVVDALYIEFING
ncbi:MAG: DNA primase [Cellulosilyticaceae bacterium]